MGGQDDPLFRYAARGVGRRLIREASSFLVVPAGHKRRVLMRRRLPCCDRCGCSIPTAIITPTTSLTGSLQQVEFEALLANTGCTLSGPSTIEPGHHWIGFTNRTGSDNVELAVRQIDSEIQRYTDGRYAPRVSHGALLHGSLSADTLSDRSHSRDRASTISMHAWWFRSDC
jgi:hypothetical protein